jgi:DNA polymerase-3 subunit alpha
MSTPAFVHLHVHTEYSLVDSVVRLPELIGAVAAAGMPAVAMTDQSNLFGLVKFYREALDAGIKPVIGAEIRVIGRDEQAEPARLVLLCRNAAGYRSLSRLLSRAWLEGQDNGVPRVQASWLDGGATSGLIALSGGPDGLLGHTLLSGPPERAERAAAACRAWFGEDFFLELQRTGRPRDNAYVEAAVRFASRMGLPVVATNDVCFLKPEEFDAHEARVCIQQGRTLADPGRPRLYSEQQYLRTPAEMQRLFADLPEALANSVEIARRCNVTLSRITPYRTACSRRTSCASRRRPGWRRALPRRDRGRSAARSRAISSVLSMSWR